jgi:hypothetical protein
MATKKRKKKQKPHKKKIAIGCGKIMGDRRKVTKYN